MAVVFTPMLADVGTILVGMAISAAFATAAGIIQATIGKPKNNFIADNRPTVLTERGSPLPMLIGRRRLPGFLWWAGDRYIQSISAGGKGLFGGGGGSQKVYHEAGMHAICVGPASELVGIYQGGTAIWTGSITPGDTPSGSHLLALHGEGQFFIYWGQWDQPVNGTLAASTRIGAGSCWPNICYVFWNRKKLGGQATWPSLEYEVVVKPLPAVLQNSAAWMGEQTLGDGTDGPNAAHVLWQLLTAPAPHGLAIPPERLDPGAFEALGQLLETEHQSSHVLALDGAQASDVIGQLLQDIAVVLPQVGDLLVPIPIRHVDAAGLPSLTDDVMVLPAPPPRGQLHDYAVSNRLVFTIPDRFNNYRDMDIQFNDDGLATSQRVAKPKSVAIPTVIDRQTALLVAGRRTQELMSQPENYTLQVTRGARQLVSGQAFILPGYGQLRVASVETMTASRTATIEAVLDQYSGEPGTYVPADIHDAYNGGVTMAPAADLVVMPREIPAALSATIALGVGRIRANSQVSGAQVWMSLDGSTYSLAGTQDAWGRGGTLQAGITAGTNDIIENGPVITEVGSDMGDTQDLSGDPWSWATGKQLALIGNEWFYLRGVTAVTGGWQLNGLIRARYDSPAEVHAIGDMVLIVDRDAISMIKSALLQPGRSVYVKMQPANGNVQVDLSTVTPVSVGISTVPGSFTPAPFVAVNMTIAASAPLAIPPTVQLPAASANVRGLATIIDAASGHAPIVYSDGTHWRYVDDYSIAL